MIVVCVCCAAIIAERTAAYPSHLHIDLLPVAQGQGLGTLMISRLLRELKSYVQMICCVI